MSEQKNSENKKLVVAWSTAGALLLGCLASAAMNPSDAPPITDTAMAASSDLGSLTIVDEPVVLHATSELIASSAGDTVEDVDTRSAETPPSPASKPVETADEPPLDLEPENEQSDALSTIAHKETAQLASSTPAEELLIEPLHDEDQPTEDVAAEPSSDPIIDTAKTTVLPDVLPDVHEANHDSLPADAGTTTSSAIPKDVAKVSKPESNAAAAKEVARSSKSKNARPFFGVGIREANSSRVTTLYVGHTAAQLGVKIGDRIVSLGGKPVTNLTSLKQALQSMQVGDPTRVTVLRDGANYELGPVALKSRSEIGF